ncbi:GNAT family N-acetyltransferase [bacterium]|nr:GNAT family N-acetyltransferase [bacterium]
MKIVPMEKDFVLARCIHCGPFSLANIEEMRSSEPAGSEEQFERNRQFLTRMIDAYGSCGMMAIDGDLVVAHARFCPQAICDQCQFCCQDPRAPITQEMVEMELPILENRDDRVLRIDCFLVNADYRGQGLSHALIEAILDWAKEHDWKAVRAYAAPDNYWLSSQICQPMLRTYAKHDFETIETAPSPEVEECLTQFRDGELGDEKRKEFEEFCGGQELSELSLLHTVQREL